MPDLLRQGSVVLYPYLWATQHRDGETEGRKGRPVCLLLRLPDRQTGLHHLILLAISSKPPLDHQAAVEVPETEKRRAGLQRYPRAWVYVSEYNHDVAERSWYLDPSQEPLGVFGAAFLKEIATAFRARLPRSARRVDRTN